MEEKYQKIKKIVEEKLSCSAHTMEHVLRVYNMCLCLAEKESDVNLDVLKLSTLLHDIARVQEDQDDSRSIDHAILGAKMAEKILRDVDYPEKEIKEVKHCISSHRFRDNNKPETKEAEILFDADKLDIMGAVGIARSFMFAGQYGQKTYLDIPIDKYIESNLVDGDPKGRVRSVPKHSPNLEFEIKLKNIVNKLYTKKAREIGQQKIDFMENFFNRLKKEIKGKL